MASCMVISSVLVLTTVGANHTLVVCFCHQLPGGFADLICRGNYRAVFGGNFNRDRESGAGGVKNLRFRGVWPTFMVKGFLLILFSLSMGLLGSGSLQVCGVKHFWGPKQFSEHVHQDLKVCTSHHKIKMVPSFMGVMGGGNLIELGAHLDLLKPLE